MFTYSYVLKHETLEDLPTIKEVRFFVQNIFYIDMRTNVRYNKIKENKMSNVIEIKKHTQQAKDCYSPINVNNKILTPVYDFDCPVPLYSDEEGQLYTAFYYSDTGKTMVIPFFNDTKSMIAFEKKMGQINMVASEFS